LKLLFEALSGPEPILILTHNDPDPDAVAGAVALQYLLAEKGGVTSVIGYHGIIGRAENKALIAYLDNPLLPLTSLEFLELTPTALVDTQPGTGNNTVPPNTMITAVIDHHPLRAATSQAKFTDIRTDVGATSTILTGYLQNVGLEPNQQLATALFYGIKTDTMGLSREASPADAAAYFYLHPKIDPDALIEIERAQVPLDYFKIFAMALRSAYIYQDAIISYIGPMAYPDMVAEIADVLLRLEGSEWIICMGTYNNTLILSVRTRNRKGGAGRLAQAVVGKEGVAGGHGTMAGGQIMLAGRNPKSVAGRLTRRVLQHLNIPSTIKGRRLV